MNKLSSLFKTAITFILLLFVLTTSSPAQTPQFYNLNNGLLNNLYPFGNNTGYQVQWLILAHDFNKLYPAPSGYITRLYFFMGSSTSTTFTDMLIKLGQTTLTSFPPGVIYTGQLDTVYFRSSVTLSSITGHWMGITLDTPYTYDTSKSLVIDVSQCAASNMSMTVRQTNLSGTTRNRIASSGSCIFNYNGQDNSVINCGIDIVPFGYPPRSYYFTQWCPANMYPSIPVPSVYGAADILGDTLYMEIGSTDGLTASALVYKYTISGNAWSSASSLPSARCQGTLTACNGKLYYIGGAAVPGGTPVTDVFEYTPSTGQWEPKAQLEFSGKSGHSAMNWGDSVIIVTGGSWSGGMNSGVLCYRPILNTWSLSAPFLGFNLTYAQAGCIIGNNIYLAGGYIAYGIPSYTNQLAIGTFGSNAQIINWAAGPPFPSCGKGGLGGIGLRGRFYIIGGTNQVGAAVSDSTFIYDITANEWYILESVKPDAATNVNASTVSWIRNDTVIVACLGGSDLYANATTNFNVIGCGPTVIGVPRVSTVPSAFALMQNYPNPFNPTTTIKFSVARAGNVDLRVYDILGREIATLVNEFKQPGEYSVEFNAGKIASGVYFYRITADNFSESKKMSVLK